MSGDSGCRRAVASAQSSRLRRPTTRAGNGVPRHPSPRGSIPARWRGSWRRSGKTACVHSLLVIRHGYAVADVDFYPYDSAATHDIASVTKTVTSTLTGVAVARGLLKLDQPCSRSSRTNGLPMPTTEARHHGAHLLYMESGLDCGFLPGERAGKMKRSANWVQYALSLPMRNNPAPARRTAAPATTCSVR